MLLMNCSRVILRFTCLLCRSVLSMMMEYDSTYTESESATTPSVALEHA